MKFLSFVSFINCAIGFAIGVALCLVHCFWWSGTFYVFGGVCLLMGIHLLIQPKE